MHEVRTSIPLVVEDKAVLAAKPAAVGLEIESMGARLTLAGKLTGTAWDIYVESHPDDYMVQITSPTSDDPLCHLRLGNDGVLRVFDARVSMVQLATLFRAPVQEPPAAPVQLTNEDWREICAALESFQRSPTTGGSTDGWREHLQDIMDKIGEDGEAAAAGGVVAIPE